MVEGGNGDRRAPIVPLSYPADRFPFCILRVIIVAGAVPVIVVVVDDGIP